MAADTLAHEAAFEAFRGDIKGFARLLKQQGVEVQGIREGVFVDGHVPFKLIDNEEVAVHEEWAESLGIQMSQVAEGVGGSGQHSPAILGHVPTEPKLRTMDGFHRSSALRAQGHERIYAASRMTSWDDLYDFRIYTAKDHIHVRFSRVVQWIREIWAHTEMAEAMTVEQAVLLYEFETDGSKLQLDPELVKEAKSWVERKEEQWQMDAMTIHGHLMVAEHVDPALVHSTRPKVGSHALTAPTQSILKVFSKQVPDNFAVQNLIMDVAMAHNLDAPKVKALCLGVKECQDSDEINDFISAIDWDTWQPEYSEGKKRAIRRAHDPRHKGAMVLDKAGREIDTVIERVGLSIQREEEVTDEMVQKVRETRAKAKAMVGKLATLDASLAELVGDEPDKVVVPKPATQPAKRPHLPSARPPVETTHRSRVGISADQSAPVTIVERPPLGVESPATIAFRTNMMDFLNGRVDEMPEIKTRTDIARAESVLRYETFSGDPIYQEEVREAIAHARTIRR